MQRALNRTVNYLKRERMIAEDTIKAQRFIITVLAGVLLAVTIVMYTNYINVCTLLDESTKHAEELFDEVTTLTASVNELTTDLTVMTRVSIKLEEENNSLINDNQALADEYDEVYNALSEIQERAELYDKYAFAIMYNGQRTDVKYSDLKHMEDIAEELGLTQDAIDLCLSFVMNESHGNEKAYNASGASGLGQLMPGTGKYVWDHLMDNGGVEYDHSTIPFDGSTNLEMSLRLLADLDNKHHSTTKVVTSYCGGWMEGYVNMLNKNLSKGPTPTTVQTMSIHE